MSILDGSQKYLTTDCRDCPFFLKGHGAMRLLQRVTLPKKHAAIAMSARMFCAWGPTLKTLMPADRPRACGIRDRAAPGAARWMAEVEKEILVEDPGLFPLA